MEVLTLITISILPVFLLGNYIYNKDQNKEPIKLLIKLFLGGIASCVLTLIITIPLSFTLPILMENPSDLNSIELFIYSFIGVALVEELCKWIFCYKFSYNHIEFDEIYDMIIYSSFVSLGFACFENLLYVIEGGAVTGIARAITAVPAHACFGVFMGYYLGLSKLSYLNNRTDLQKKHVIKSIIIPTIMHGIYDYCLFSQNIILVLILIILIIYTYINTVNKVKRISSITNKLKYKDNYCPICGTSVKSNYCPKCGRKNE